MSNRKILISGLIILTLIIMFFAYNMTKNRQENTEEYSNSLASEQSTESESSNIPVSEQSAEITSSDISVFEETTELYYNESYLPYIEIDDKCIIYKYAEIKGEEYDYAIFEMAAEEPISNELSKYHDILYWEIIVLKNNSVVTVLRENKSEYSPTIAYRELKNIVIEKDVNFDGKNDILIYQGHFGAQGLITFSCYLQTKNGFELCPSFSDIPNPAVDSENKVILSSWRNMAVSHSYAMYYFIDGEFVQKERLTEEPVMNNVLEEDEIVWSWKIEEFVDGQWVTKEYFTEEDYDKDVLYQSKVYGPDAHWDILQDRWRTLFNNGKMSDMSIYSSEYVTEN